MIINTKIAIHTLRILNSYGLSSFSLRETNPDTFSETAKEIRINHNGVSDLLSKCLHLYGETIESWENPVGLKEMKLNIQEQARVLDLNREDLPYYILRISKEDVERMYLVMDHHNIDEFTAINTILAMAEAFVVCGALIPRTVEI